MLVLGRGPRTSSCPQGNVGRRRLSAPDAAVDNRRYDLQGVTALSLLNGLARGPLSLQQGVCCCVPAGAWTHAAPARVALHHEPVPGSPWPRFVPAQETAGGPAVWRDVVTRWGFWRASWQSFQSVKLFRFKAGKCPARPGGAPCAVEPKATLNKSLAARSSLFWAVCGVANPRHSGAMAVVRALQPIPNQGAHTREDLFSMALNH